MTISGLPEPCPTLCSRWRSLAWPAIVGFLLGYIVLHPVSMVVFRWLDPRIAAAGSHDKTGTLLGPVAHSFHLSMLPMGLVFGVVGALIATFYACYRTIARWPVLWSASADRLMG